MRRACAKLRAGGGARACRARRAGPARARRGGRGHARPRPRSGIHIHPSEPPEAPHRAGRCLPRRLGSSRRLGPHRGQARPCPPLSPLRRTPMRLHPASMRLRRTSRSRGWARPPDRLHRCLCTAPPRRSRPRRGGTPCSTKGSSPDSSPSRRPSLRTCPAHRTHRSGRRRTASLAPRLHPAGRSPSSPCTPPPRRTRRPSDDTWS